MPVLIYPHWYAQPQPQMYASIDTDDVQGFRPAPCLPVYRVVTDLRQYEHNIWYRTKRA